MSLKHMLFLHLANARKIQFTTCAKNLRGEILVFKPLDDLNLFNGLNSLNDLNGLNF